MLDALDGHNYKSAACHTFKSCADSQALHIHIHIHVLKSPKKKESLRGKCFAAKQPLKVWQQQQQQPSSGIWNVFLKTGYADSEYLRISLFMVKK